MYQFHYEKLLTKYSCKIELCFTLFYEVETEDIYGDMQGDDDYDFSEYPFTHP